MLLCEICKRRIIIIFNNKFMIKLYGFYVQYDLFNQFGGIFHSMTTEVYKDEKINYLI